MPAAPEPIPFTDAAEKQLGAAMRALFERRGFTALHEAMIRQTEQLAVEHRVRLARQGWVA